MRIGNAASTQLQLDIYGELMDAVYLANKYGRPSSHEGLGAYPPAGRMVAGQLAQAGCRHLGGAGEMKNFLHSRLMCWVAVDRAIRLAQKRSLPAPLPEWNQLRLEIYEAIHEEHWNAELNSFVQYPGLADARRVDAADAARPVHLATGSALAGHDGAYPRASGRGRAGVPPRRSGPRAGRAGGSGGSFLACSFWFVECLARAGDVGEARLLFEKLLGYASPLGLYAGGAVADGDWHQGNYPQALTHLALISAASYLNRALEGETQQAWS